MRKRKQGFTLVELLVVIAIIGMLAGLLLPAIARSRERARETECENNLKQFSLALTMYRQDFGNDQLPDFLSDLYDKYINSPKSYVCGSDETEGAEGSRPEVMPPKYGDQYTETDDIDRKPGIRCSYLYQFCNADCEWNDRSYVKVPDGMENTWMNVKKLQLLNGDEDNGYRPYEQTFFPIISCFHHWEKRTWQYNDGTSDETLGLMINVAYAGNIFRSSFRWDLPEGTAGLVEN